MLLEADSETVYIRRNLMESKSTSKLEDALRRYLTFINAMGIRYSYIAKVTSNPTNRLQSMYLASSCVVRRSSTEEHMQSLIDPFEPSETCGLLSYLAPLQVPTKSSQTPVS